MTTDDFLDAEALAKLTGRRRKSMQIAELRRLGLPFFVNAHGEPVVTRSAIEGKKTAAQADESHWKPSWAM